MINKNNYDFIFYLAEYVYFSTNKEVSTDFQ